MCVCLSLFFPLSLAFLGITQEQQEEEQKMKNTRTKAYIGINKQLEIEETFIAKHRKRANERTNERKYSLEQQHVNVAESFLIT